MKCGSGKCRSCMHNNETTAAQPFFVSVNSSGNRDAGSERSEKGFYFGESRTFNLQKREGHTRLHEARRAGCQVSSGGGHRAARWPGRHAHGPAGALPPPLRLSWLPQSADLSALSSPAASSPSCTGSCDVNTFGDMGFQPFPGNHLPTLKLSVKANSDTGSLDAHDQIALWTHLQGQNLDNP